MTLSHSSVNYYKIGWFYLALIRCSKCYNSKSLLISIKLNNSDMLSSPILLSCSWKEATLLLIATAYAIISAWPLRFIHEKFKVVARHGYALISCFLKESWWRKSAISWQNSSAFSLLSGFLLKSSLFTLDCEFTIKLSGICINIFDDRLQSERFKCLRETE